MSGVKFLFKDQQNQIHAFDTAVPDLPNLTLISLEEANAILHPPKTIAQLATAAMAEVNAQYITRMAAVANPYPLHERESWPIQLSEAKELLIIGANAVTPWIDQCAHQRGLDRMELAQRILSKDTAYRTVSGFLSGVRQWHEDCIDGLLALGDEARDDLQKYDSLQGWEPEKTLDPELNQEPVTET